MVTVRAGKLRHRITIQQMTEIKDATGGVTESWSAFAAVWAAVEPLRGREFFAAEQVNSDVTHRIKLRYTRGVTPKMRVLFEARIFDIKAVLNLEERNRELQLMCVEVI